MLKEIIDKIIVIALIGLLFFVFLHKCGDSITTTRIKTKTVTDTLRKTVVDTVPFYNIKDSIRITNLTITDTVKYEDSLSIGYTTAVEDSLLSGKIFTKVLTDGTLVSQDFTYIPKFPKYITKTDSIFINKHTIESKTTTKQSWGIYAGTSIVPTNEFGLYGTVGFKTRKGLYLGAGYDPFNNNALIELKFKLNK